MKYFIYSILILGVLSMIPIYASVSDSEVIGKINACLESKNPKSITDYVCAKGDFLKETGEHISDEHVAYLVIMSVKFKELDDELLKEMQKLQKRRETNGLSWIEYINTTIKPLGEKYYDVCTALGGDARLVSLWKKEQQQAATTSGFPQTYCTDLAQRKAVAWENMSYILASKGIAKGYQNDKDKHFESIKGKYNQILEKWQWYQRIFDTAVTKLTAYTKDPVQ